MIKYSDISLALLNELKTSLAGVFGNIPVQWPGQLSIGEQNPDQTFAIVEEALSAEQPITLGRQPLYRSSAQVICRIVASLAPTEIITAKRLASDVKDRWRTAIQTSDTDAVLVDIQIVPREADLGRFLIDVVLGYVYYG